MHQFFNSHPEQSLLSSDHFYLFYPDGLNRLVATLSASCFGICDLVQHIKTAYQFSKNGIILIKMWSTPTVL